LTKALDLQVLLDDWKDLVLTLRVHRNTMKKDASLVNKWDLKRQSVLDRLSQLSWDEQVELNKAYMEWYRKDVSDVPSE
jgi:hypothetical protein